LPELPFFCMHVLIFEGTLPCLSGNSSTKRKMNTKYWWNDTDGAEPKCSEQSLCQCHSSPPQISHGLTQNWIWVSTVISWQLTS